MMTIILIGLGLIIFNAGFVVGAYGQGGNCLSNGVYLVCNRQILRNKKVIK